jgi:hypothetical protein
MTSESVLRPHFGLVKHSTLETELTLQRCQWRRWLRQGAERVRRPHYQLVGSVPKRPPMETISRVTHDLRRRCARRARTVRGQCVKGPRFVIGSRLGTDSTVVAGRLPFAVCRLPFAVCRSAFGVWRLAVAVRRTSSSPQSGSSLPTTPKKKARVSAQAFDLSPTMVGTAGFEPTTLCPPGRCATRLRYAPMLLVLSPPCSGPTSITGLIEKGFSGAAAAALLPAPSGSA